MPKNKNLFSTKEIAGVMCVTCKTQATRTLSVLNEWRQEGLCDLVIKVGDTSVRGHRYVLAVHSDYFKAMFMSGMEETSSREIVMDGFNHTRLSELIDFMYTGVLKVSVDSAQEFVILSDMLQMAEVKEICATYMQRHLDTSNCIGIKEFGEKYNCMNLVTKAMMLIKQRFQGVAHTEEFLTLSLDSLIQILQCPDIHLGPLGEDVALEAAVRWLEHDVVTRREEFPNVLLNIHIQSVSSVCLGRVRGLAVIQESPDILNCLESQLNSPDGPQVRAPVHYIYVIGGYLQSRTGPSCPRLKSVERYDVQRNEWTAVSPLPLLASGLQAFNIQGHLVVFASDLHTTGGTDDNITRVYEYNYLEDTWEDLTADVQHSVLRLVEQGFMAGCAMAYSDQRQCIYILTGKGFHQLAVCEEDGEVVFGDLTQLTTLTWESDGECYLDDVTLVVCQGRVHTVGGTLRWSKLQFEPLNRVWRYEHDANNWTERACMHVPRARVGVVSLGSQIYAVGGFNKYRERTCESYSSLTNTWTRLADMDKHRSFCSLVTVCGKIWALGGKSYAFGCGGARKVLNTVESYDVDTDCWSTMAPMAQPRCRFAAVVL